MTSIGVLAFNNCSGLTSITIPNSVTSIDNSAFKDCSSITVFYCFAETVPTTGVYGVFYSSDISNATLHVPASAIENYSNKTPWSGLGNIVALVASDIIEDEDYISFVDLNVQALCMANWDTDRNGLLSYAEAAAVTDLGEVFADNTDITSFDELQYFMGLTAIDDNAFMGCSNLASVTLPENITFIGTYAFYGCKALTTFTIPQGVNEVGAYAFRGCTGLTDVYCLPLDVSETASKAFNNSNISNATFMLSHHLTMHTRTRCRGRTSRTCWTIFLYPAQSQPSAMWRVRLYLPVTRRMWSSSRTSVLLTWTIIIPVKSIFVLLTI